MKRTIILAIVTTIQYSCLLVYSQQVDFQDATLDQNAPDLAKEPQILQQDNNEDLHYIPEELVEVKPDRKCVPMLNLPAYLNNSMAAAPETNLSFSIGDIDMPVTPASGSINSAFKLLSTFDSQFEPTGEEEQAENMVKFRNNHLQIQGLNLSMLNVHLYTDSDPRFGIGIAIKNTTLTGQFSYNGPLVIGNSKLAGFYRMSIDNIYLVASSNLTKYKNENEKETSKQFNLLTKDFKMNITNLGYISIDIYDSKDSNKPTSNYLLRILQRLMQKTVKRTYYTFQNYIRETLETEGKRSFDCELSRFTPLLDNSSASSHQSDLGRIISNEINKSQLSTVPLPPFEHQQNVFGAIATIHFQNGSLKGLDNVKLNGETRIKLQDEHLFVNASIGWNEIRPYYNWELFIGANKQTSPMSKGFVSFNIKNIEFDAVITKGLKPHTRIVVDELVIRKLDSPKMDMSGLPGMNRLTRATVNFFMGRLKQRLTSSIQPALKQQLEKSLNKMNMFI